MKHLLIIISILLFLGCEETQLIRHECPVGQTRECSWDANSTQLPEGLCKYGKQLCTSSGWGECIGAVGPATEICDGLDNDCDLQVDESYPEESQLCGFVEGANYGTGICVPGVMICDEGYLYCSGHVGPAAEICDGIDNNCNGTVDESVANTTAVVCYSGPENTMAVGVCRAGVKYCSDGGFDGPCDGEVTPTVEVCDDLDNDCDGEVDEGFDQRNVEIVFVLDISGSFDDEIDSMIQGIAPLLDDPITSSFRFGLVVVGTDGPRHGAMQERHSTMIVNLVPANEFLEHLESTRTIPSAGIEPTLDTLLWTMNGTYPFSWSEDSQKVIITMTDERAQSIIGTDQITIRQMSIDLGFELFVFARPEDHISFSIAMRGQARRLFSPSVDSVTVFQQIKQIFEDLCVGP